MVRGVETLKRKFPRCAVWEVPSEGRWLELGSFREVGTLAVVLLSLQCDDGMGGVARAKL